MREIDDGEWDHFVASITGDTIAQTTAWGRTKDSRFEASTVGIRDESRLVAGCLLMRGRIGGIRVMYAPRGPLVSPGSDDVAHRLVDEILRLAGRWRPGAILLQPVREPAELAEALASSGFGPAPVDITTPATVEIPLEVTTDELFSRLRSSRRRNIRKAEKAGLSVRRGNHDDLTTFARLHEHTAVRQGFAPMSSSYLERQWDELGRQGMLSIYLAELDGVALSAATVTTFGDRAVFKLAGLSEDPLAGDVRASDFLHWQIMLDAKRRGFRFYDLGGFDKDAAQLIADGGEPPESLRASASQFKLGFGGQVKVLPPARWRVVPSVLRPLQYAVTTAADRVPRIQTALVRLRD